MRPVRAGFEPFRGRGPAPDLRIENLLLPQFGLICDLS
jgi:hypothetical protein